MYTSSTEPKIAKRWKQYNGTYFETADCSDIACENLQYKNLKFGQSYYFKNEYHPAYSKVTNFTIIFVIVSL